MATIQHINWSHQDVIMQKKVINNIITFSKQVGADVFGLIEIVNEFDKSDLLENLIGSKASNIIFNPYVDMAISTNKWHNEYKYCIKNNSKSSCAASTILGASAEAGVKVLGGIGIASGITMTTSGVGAVPGVICATSGFALSEISHDIGINIHETVIDIINNRMQMPANVDIDFTKDITVSNQNGFCVTFPASSVESRILNTTNQIYNDSVALKNYIGDQHRSTAMVSHNSINRSIDEVRTLITKNDILRNDIQEIQDGNVDISGLFATYHSDYFNSSSPNSNYMDGVGGVEQNCNVSYKSFNGFRSNNHDYGSYNFMGSGGDSWSFNIPTKSLSSSDDDGGGGGCSIS